MPCIISPNQWYEAVAADVWSRVPLPLFCISNDHTSPPDPVLPRPPPPRARPIDCGARAGRIVVIVTLSEIKLHPQYRPYYCEHKIHSPSTEIQLPNVIVRSKFGASNRAFEESMTELN
ncbi:jg19535 [Pararge aegeria aegeria]|uniref:Jg19535 protein n=1 Tax=Pararge aegeria aegeria TaxID=348720 RepID=A0A8S4R4P4_9NEOP|nr:jg19535 [Pararge aegeria aegeria]